MSQHTCRLETGLPYLPGTSFRDYNQSNYHKSHVFEVKNGCRTIKDVPGIGNNTLHSTYAKSASNSLQRLVQKDGGSVAPAFLFYDRKVLRFEAYFKEPVVETAYEQYRVRRCFIYYFLDDETVQITEPEIENSQLPQGTILSRQKVYPEVPSPILTNDFDHYAWDIFNVGESINIFGRVYRLVDCDKSTRQFLTSNGVEVPSPLPIPQDTYTDVIRKTIEDHSSYCITPNLDELPFRKFLNLDGKVLCFYASWQDAEVPRHFVIHYFLCDDSLEIIEVRTHNSGRSDTSQFLKRQKLPKPGKSSPYNNPEPVSWKEFHLGEYLPVYNRPFLILDVDQFTREWFEKNNVELGEAIPRPTPSKGPISRTKAIDVIVPAHQGIGSEEDSLANCLSLIPKQPVKKAHYLLQGQEPQVLRFEAELLEDPDRHFVLSYFTEDSTLSIFEPQVKNSGIVSGLFLGRSKVPKADGSKISADDLKVGSEVSIFSRVFKLTKSDKRNSREV
ncbi:hypothetical protein GEMRC1_011281 [Eukaryota sp. GEM-RC1]